MSRALRIFAGGDLNIPSENLMLKHHAGAVVAQKIEKPRDARTSWDIYKFDRAANAGELEFISKHDD